MNTQSALSFVPQLIVSLSCICCVVRVSAAETNFSASIIVHLARESFLETEEIRGKIHLKLLPGKSAGASSQAEGDVAPRLELLFDSELAAVPLEVAMNRSLDKSVMAGGEVDVPFEIRTWPEFSQRLRSLEGIARLRRGRHHCYSVLQRFAGYGPPVSPWTGIPSMNWFTTIGATQHFEILASGARSVSSEELVQAARGGADSFKMTIASVFCDHGRLAADDLLPIMESAGPETKGRLAGLFQNRGGALEGLTPFFERPKDRVLLETHTNAPFFLKVAPGEALRVVYDTTVLHNVNGLNQNYVVLGKLEKIVHAPKQPGVYRVGCDIHVSTWAWVLVTDSNK